MQNFTNDTIDVTALPKFEDVQLTPLQPAYWKIMLVNIVITYLIIGAGAGAALYFIDELSDNLIIVLVVYFVLLGLTFLFLWLNFRNRGFAFRTHDVIYRSGAISITTTIIPYNRVQHAAVHEGWLSRIYGLASVEIFTAGGSNSDIKIPGILKADAENIKQLLMGKIQTEVAHEH